MAKKKAAKSTAAKKKKTAPPGKRPAPPKKAAKKKAAKKKPAKKKAAAKRAKKASVSKSAKRMPRPKTPATRAAGQARRSSKKRKPPSGAPARPASKPAETMTITIEEQGGGELTVSEPIGGSIQVHHTIPPGREETSIPGMSYDELKELGPGTHEVEIHEETGPEEADETKPSGEF